LSDVGRRRFLTLLGGAAVAWPLAARAALASEASGQRGDSKVRAPDTRPETGSSARAQQGERMRRIAVFSARSADDPEWQARMAAFHQGLQELGWIVGRTIRIEHRVGFGDGEFLRRRAAELAALAPDVIVVNGNSAMTPLLQATRQVPVVFVNVSDPVSAGFVASLARPGGNATGFTLLEFGMSGKWLELLKQIAPGLKRAVVLRDAATSNGIAQFAVLSAAAHSLGVAVSPLDEREPDGIERGVAAFASAPDGGLIQTTSAVGLRYRELIIGLAARHRLPAIYPYRHFSTDGGLMSYGTDTIDGYRRAAGYVDRILKGEKPADLPVQQPTKFELVINLKTAKALNLDVPPSLLVAADEVIE
jgi:putative tryptophan/tyrosine transport system substrate-binding protein